MDDGARSAVIFNGLRVERAVNEFLSISPAHSERLHPDFRSYNENCLEAVVRVTNATTSHAL
jgi:hypothetical protein